MQFTTGLHIENLLPGLGVIYIGNKMPSLDYVKKCEHGCPPVFFLPYHFCLLVQCCLFIHIRFALLSIPLCGMIATLHIGRRGQGFPSRGPPLPWCWVHCAIYGPLPAWSLVSAAPACIVSGLRACRSRDPLPDAGLT